MTKDQINKLVSEGEFPAASRQRELIETHISWVILCDQFVYKIKKPVHYSFLDFSTVERRKYYCEKEIALNRRLTENIYLDVQPIHEWQGQFIMGGNKGALTDYAVRMNKLDREKQMDILLIKNKITENEIQRLAKKIASFHQDTLIIYRKDFLDIEEKFRDLAAEKEFLENLAAGTGNIISHAVEVSDAFMERSRELLAQRSNKGYFRDCHGDLHSRNIFLLPEPEPFDCIEFNDDFRQIDVLNEVAFLCMDLDAANRRDLSELFIKYYNQFFASMVSDADRSLFIYYKSYRANIRAKVNSLRAKSAANDTDKVNALAAADKYLRLMDGYIASLK